jgi:proteasome assembly chaperone (PAC2) family protein
MLYVAQKLVIGVDMSLVAKLYSLHWPAIVLMFEDAVSRSNKK